MATPIVFEDKFGEQRTAGYALSGSDYEGELYEVLAVNLDICDDIVNLAKLSGACNIDKREGYDIHPIRDSFGEYVWWHYERRLVLCLGRGLWG